MDIQLTVSCSVACAHVTCVSFYPRKRASHSLHTRRACIFKGELNVLVKTWANKVSLTRVQIVWDGHVWVYEGMLLAYRNLVWGKAVKFCFSVLTLIILNPA